MINLESVLPEIERAVDDRTESKTLARMGDGDLRDLVYKLVARLRGAQLDPTRHLSELVATAGERHSDFVEAREYSVTVRTRILELLLQLLAPAFPALLGPIVTSAEKRRDAHEVRSHHKSLRGFELASGEKIGPVAPGVYERSGKSWWIVGTPGGRDSDPIPGLFAVARHHGTLDEGGVGRTWSEIEIVSPSEAAAHIRDDQFEKIIGRIQERLVALSAKNLTKRTDSLWSVANVLDSGLKAMRSMAADYGR